jgi:hypothetical protein
MENKKFLGQANELGPNHGKAIRTETERKNLGVCSLDVDINPLFVLNAMFFLGMGGASILLGCLLWWLL